jgi:hypothetical protein
MDFPGVEMFCYGFGLSMFLFFIGRGARVIFSAVASGAEVSWD